MINLQLPLSALALRLGSDFLAVLAEHADTIRSEMGAPGAPDLRNLSDLAQLLPQQPAPVPKNDPDESDDNEKVFEVATPAPAPLVEQIAREVSAGVQVIEDPKPDAAPVTEPETFTGSTASGLAPAPGVPEPTPAAPSAAPELAYHEDRAGYPLEAMRTAGWSDQALVDAGYAEWVEPAPKPQASAPSAPVPPAPPAPPAPGTAPSESDSSASSSTGSVELDKAGLPWDERIHSSSRNLVADGTWRRKRGVDESLVQTVEAELRSIPKAAGAGVPTAPSAPIAPVSAPVPPAATAPAPGLPSTFPELTAWLVAATRAGKISPTDVQLAIMGCGVEGINMLPHLSARPDLIPEVVGRLAPKVGAA